MSTVAVKTKVFVKYPLSSVFIYNGATILHYLLGYLGIYMGYRMSIISGLAGSLYLLFALFQMYLLMPLTVCPNCLYTHRENFRCISGLNLFSKKIASKGKLEDFPKRAKGLFCHNHLYMAALIIPVAAMLPALVLNFSMILLGLFLVIVGLLLFRVFVIFSKIACVHCSAKKGCPNAQSMGLSNS